MDYRLKQIYESMLRGEQAPIQNSSLSNLCEMARKPKIPAGPKPPAASYDNVIAKALFGDSTLVGKIPTPVGDYKLGGNYKVHPDDMKAYSALFPVTPPKADQDIDTAVAGTKGSGNGEIALYWLLKKMYHVTDNRSAGKPDLSVIEGGVEKGVEVKAYDTKIIGLGRFGDQRQNRGLLSIVFGLKALLAGLSPSGPAKRTPSLDTFNKEELTTAFETLLLFDGNKQLREAASSGNFVPINEIYKQVDSVIDGLGLISGKYTPEQGAAKMLLAFLTTKLSEKPGFGGYMANVKGNGEISYHLIPSKEELERMSPEIILNNVNANGAALLIRADSLFPSH